MYCFKEKNESEGQHRLTLKIKAKVQDMIWNPRTHLVKFPTPVSLFSLTSETVD